MLKSETIIADGWTAGSPKTLRDIKNNLRKVAEEEEICTDSEHNPPSNIVLSSGTYDWICPKCGQTKRFKVQKPTL